MLLVTGERILDKGIGYGIREVLITGYSVSGERLCHEKMDKDNGVSSPVHEAKRS